VARSGASSRWDRTLIQRAESARHQGVIFRRVGDPLTHDLANHRMAVSARALRNEAGHVDGRRLANCHGYGRVHAGARLRYRHSIGVHLLNPRSGRCDVVPACRDQCPKGPTGRNVDPYDVVGTDRQINDSGGWRSRRTRCDPTLPGERPRNHAKGTPGLGGSGGAGPEPTGSDQPCIQLQANPPGRHLFTRDLSHEYGQRLRQMTMTSPDS